MTSQRVLDLTLINICFSEVKKDIAIRLVYMIGVYVSEL